MDYLNYNAKTNGVPVQKPAPTKRDNSRSEYAANLSLRSNKGNVKWK